MRNGMIATNIDVSWCPVLNRLWVPSRLSIMGASIAPQIPARASIAIKRIGLAYTLNIIAIFIFQSHFQPLFGFGKWRTAGVVRLIIFHLWVHDR